MTSRTRAIVGFRLFFLCAALGFGLAGSALAAAVSWNGNTSTDWGTGSNWSSGVVPTSADDITIPTGRPNYPVVVAAQNFTAKTITIALGGSLTVQGGQLATTGNFADNGTFSQSGGTFMSGNDFTGTGTNTQSGGIFTVDHDFKPSTFTSSGGMVEQTG